MITSWDEMQARVVSTLQALVRLDTSSPPGNEIACATYIRDRLAAEGIEAIILEPAPGRGSVIARLKGDGSQPPLLLLSHLDVVMAEAEAWKYPPFSGQIVDGYLWGRGSLDCKGLTATELEVFLLLNRLGLRLKRDVILAATADEEAGGANGVGWLVENHFDLLQAEYAISEGGGVGNLIGNHWLFGVRTAEKGVCWTRLRARGQSGHAARPVGESAVAKLAGAVDRLARARLPQHPIPTVETYIRTLSQILPPATGQAVLGLLDPESEEAALQQFPDRALVPSLRAFLHNTATPTILRAGQRMNVIPSVAEADVDCRILPGQTAADALAEMRAHIGDDIEMEVLRTSPGVESDYDSPVFDTMRQVLAELVPNSLVVPCLGTGVTDGRFLAWKGMKVYGFQPVRAMPGEVNMLELMHSHNERVSLDNVRFGVQVLWEVVRRICTG